MAKKNNKNSLGSVVAKVASVAALSAGAYLLFGPDGKKNRKKVKGWAIKMKGEMIEKFEKLQEVTEPAYHEIVDQISDKYKKQGISEEEVQGAVSEIKKYWKKMVKEFSPKKAPVKKSVKKVAKK